MKKSAGLLIIQDNKILLAHPTNMKWEHSYSIPKGGIEVNETIKQAAIRETFEEVGINIDENLISDNYYTINYTNKSGNLFKKVYYYIVKLESGSLPEIFPEVLLQKSEVDWAGFLDYKNSKEKIFWRFKEMLDFI